MTLGSFAIFVIDGCKLISLWFCWKVQFLVSWCRACDLQWESISASLFQILWWWPLALLSWWNISISGRIYNRITETEKGSVCILESAQKLPSMFWRISFTYFSCGPRLCDLRRLVVVGLVSILSRGFLLIRLPYWG